MTNSQQHPKKPSPRQLGYLKNLAMSTGGSFAYPSTFAAADREIKRLKARKRTNRADRRRETRAVRDAMARGRGNAASVQAHEVGGYGSSATWAGRG